MNRSRPAGELFIRDADGRATDAALHEEILAEGDSRAAALVSLRVLLRQGWNEAEARRALGLPPGAMA
jgi:hypothetical protein